MPPALPLTSPIPLAGELPPPPAELAALVAFATIGVGLIGLLLYLAQRLGQRSRTPVKDEPFESGIAPSGAARLRDPVPFYLVAIFFLVFDVEAIFIFSWAVAWQELGWAGFSQIVFFIVILLVGLACLWKSGGLDWGPKAARRP